MREQTLEGSPTAVSSPQVEGSPAVVSGPQVEESSAVVSGPQVGGSPAVVSGPEVERSPAVVSGPEVDGSPAVVSSGQVEGYFAVVSGPQVERSSAVVSGPQVEGSTAVVSGPQVKHDSKALQCSPALVGCSPAVITSLQVKQDGSTLKCSLASVGCSPAVVSSPQVQQDSKALQSSPALVLCSPVVVSSPQVQQDIRALQCSPALVGCSPAVVSNLQVKQDGRTLQCSPGLVGCSPAVISSLQVKHENRALQCSPVLVGCSPAVVSCSQTEHIEVLESVDIAPETNFDSESSGYISSGQFWTLLQKYGSDLDPHKLDVLMALARSNAEGKICYQDVLNLVGNKRSNSFRRAILQGNRHLCNKALLEESSLDLTQRLIRHVAYDTLPREIDRKWFYDNYTGCPPPWFMITVTMIEVAIFVYYGLQLDRFVLQVMHSQYLKQNPLVYHPQLRAQAWRYLSYMFMHAGIEHLGVNVALQLLVGVPLEMVHGALRVGFVYVAGVLAGSLAVSVADMTAPVVGSSGGVYAIVSAHLANIVMNWSGMRCQFKLLRLSFTLICMSLEFGRAVWLRFYPSSYAPCPHPSFVAHLSGVVVGITLGVVILRNFEQRLQDQWLWWIFFSSFVLFTIFAVFWNVFAFSMAGLRLPPPP